MMLLLSYGKRAGVGIRRRDDILLEAIDGDGNVASCRNCLKK